MPVPATKKAATIVKSMSTEALDSFDTTIESTTKRLDTLLSPARQTFASRYPTAFSLLATFGVAATFLGFEQLLMSSLLLEKYPVLIFFIGIAVLVVTGTLYKKLQ